MTSVATPATSARAASFARASTAPNKIRSHRGIKRCASITTTARRGGAATARAAGRDDQPADYTLKYLYDGGCTVCNALVKLLKSKKGHEKIWCAREEHDTPSRHLVVLFSFFLGGSTRAR